LLHSVVAALAAVRLEAILIGNAAAALQGSPVTTVDFDFLFRATPVNLAKLKRFARRLEAMILRPYFPASALFRVVNDEQGLQVDFMPAIHGVSPSTTCARTPGLSGWPDTICGWRIWPTSSPANAPPDGPRTRPCSGCWRRHCVKKSNRRDLRQARLAALRRESDRELLELIRRRLALPVEKRMHFLRVRLPGGGSHL
jgi:hypothetical protein